MNKIQYISAFFLFIFSCNIGFAQDVNIVDFGAIPDGVTLNTKAIQAAVDKAHENSGGRVIIPSGIFLSGTIKLKSNVELHLEKNATILGSTNVNHYSRSDGDFALIAAYNQNNISISGEGTIDGQGQKLALFIDSLHHTGEQVDPNYNYRRMRSGNRPNLVKLRNCENVKIVEINAIASANWVFRLDKCNQMVIDGIKVNSDVYWNNDGIDLEDCKNVRMVNCFVNAADDGICLKSNDPDSFCDQIYIANNTIRSSASAIKFGTASAGGFKNITIENIKIYDTFRSALAFESVDGGTLENISAKNITATNTGNAIFIRLGHRNTDGKVGVVRNIKIENMIVDIPFTAPDINYNIRGPELPFFHNPFPASITGIPNHYVENITLENIEISYPGRANKGYAHVSLWNLDIVPENESSYPEFSMFGELPSWGFYVRHVNGLELNNVRLNVRKEDFRPAYVFDDVKNLKIKEGNIASPVKTDQVVIKNVHQAIIENLLIDWEKLINVPGYGAHSGIEGVNVQDN